MPSQFTLVDVTSDLTVQLVLEWDANRHHPANPGSSNKTPPTMTFSTWLFQTFVATGVQAPVWTTCLLEINPIPLFLHYFHQTGAWTCSGKHICFLLPHFFPSEAPKAPSLSNNKPWILWSYLMADPAWSRLLCPLPTGTCDAMILSYFGLGSHVLSQC